MKKPFTTALLSLLGVLLLALNGKAAPFNEDDLLLGFHATSGTGATQTYVFNLRSNTSYRDATGNIAIANIGTDLAGIFGPNWFTRPDIYWGAAGAWSAFPNGVMNGDPSRTAYVTRNATGPGQSTPWTGFTSPSLGTATNDIKSFQTSFSDPGVDPTQDSGGRGVIVPDSANNSWEFWNPQPGGPSFTVFGGGIEGTLGTGGSPAYLDLYRILARTSGANPSGPVGTGTLEGTITINAAGDVTFTVPPAPTPPTITSETTARGTQGESFSYQITATGNPTSFNAIGLPPGLSINTATGLISGNPTTSGTSQVTLSATNAFGTGMQTLTLTIAPPPTAPPVITSPADASGTQGESFSYQIVATQNPSSYGAIGLPSGLTVNTVSGRISGTPATSGNSQVTLSATNSAGTGTQVLSLTITPAPTPTPTPIPTPTPTPPPTPASFENVSTRGRVETGDNVLIGGFIITGSTPKKVMVRAIGPSLAADGVANALLDPVLRLHDSQTQIAANDNWEDSEKAAILATQRAPGDDRESAIIRTLLPGAYTAIVSGFQGMTGVALVEVYDLDTAAPATFANISTRGFVQTQDNVLIGGFIVGGSQSSASVVVRALGPSLSGEGITNPLADPILQLHDANGVMVDFNDNWRDDSREGELRSAALAPGNDNEPAIFRSVPPGAYTVVVRGANNTVGVALFEAFRVLP